MKRTTTLSAFLMLLCIIANAQSKKIDRGRTGPTQVRIATEADATFIVKGVSPSTAQLLLDMVKMKSNPEAMSEAELMEKYSLKKRGNVLYVNSFLQGTDQLSMDELKQYGVIPGIASGKIRTAMIPIEKIVEVAGDPLIKSVDIGGRMTLSMDSARKATGVDKVHQGMSPLNMAYTGKDVVVGIMDIGLDFTHPNFYDTTGVDNYRIKKVWKQRDNSGVPPAGYSYGSEFTTQFGILGARTDDSSNIGEANHGSHTTGTAAGAGGYPNSPYRGVAYESDIVFVGVDLWCESCVAEGIQYIQDHAASVGKPCVINMSFGGHQGTHDGTGPFCQFTEGATGPGKLLVASAGNQGNKSMYLGHTFQSVDTIAQTLLTGAGEVYMIGEPNQNFSVRVLLLNNVTQLIEDETPFKIPAMLPGFAFSDTMWGANNVPVTASFTCSIDPASGRSTMLLNCQKFQYDPARYFLIEITAYNTTTQMWGDGTSFTDLAYNYGLSYGMPVPMYNGTKDHTTSDQASGDGVISVGAYTSKDFYMSLNNVPQGLSPGFNLTAIGDIATFSSRGPTADGRTKPDICAPGNVMISSVNSFSPYYNVFNPETAGLVNYGSDIWYFGAMQGTSMSCPMVTGILALWLQQDPTMTRDQAIARMKATAITDNHTGVIPADGSNRWGWGKINAFGGLVTVSVENVPGDMMMKVYPNPASNELHLAFGKEANGSVVDLHDITGRQVYHKELKSVPEGHIEHLNTEGIAAGIYILKVTSGTETASYKVVKQ